MNFSTLQIVFWAAGFIGHAALLYVLVRKHRWRTFPVFTSLILFQAIVSVVLFAMWRYGEKGAYGRAYWTAAVVDFAFQLALLYEMASIVLRPTGTWVRDARNSFLLWSGFAVVVAFGASVAISPPASSTLSKLEVRGVIFTSLLICEIFLAMIAAANRLGLQWRSHVMALGQGLTIWAMSALISDAAHIALGWDRNFAVLDYIRYAFYLGALVLWIVAFWLPERERASLSPDMNNYLVALHGRVQYDLDRIAVSKKQLL